MQHAAIAKLHIFAHDSIRVDLHAFSQLRAYGDGSLRMNLRLCHFTDFSVWAAGTRSTILHINVASAAS